MVRQTNLTGPWAVEWPNDFYDRQSSPTEDDSGSLGGSMRDRFCKGECAYRHHVLAAIAALVLFFSNSSLWAQGSGGSASRRQEAAQQIPFDQLQPQAVDQLQAIVESPTIYRQMPVETIQCDPNLYVFLLRHPEVVVNMWQLMGVTKCQMTRTADYAFEAFDGSGTKSQIELVYGTRNLHVYYAEGAYSGSLLRRKITGRSVIVVSSNFQQAANQQSQVTTKMDVFLQLDNAGAELVAKTLHPIMGRTVDTNFQQSAKFVGQLSDVAHRNPDGMQRLSARLNNVKPEVRNKFSLITRNIGSQGAALHLSDQPTSVERE